MPSGIWIFGYGSLMWRPGFAYQTRVTGYVEGWTRRFWQGSTDHRGTSEAPGRVVTLVPEAGARCFGIGYWVDQADARAVLEELDVREQDGYERLDVRLNLLGQNEAHASVTYVAGPRSRNYLGEASLEEIARQIRTSHGPSGSNRAYVLELAAVLAGMGVQDRQVSDLARLLGQPDRAEATKSC